MTTQKIDSVPEGGDARREIIIQRLLATLCLSDSPVVRDAAVQIQSSADLLFHGGLTAVDEIAPARVGPFVCRFVAELVIAEMLDHGLRLQNLRGDLLPVPATIEKGGGTVETNWPTLTDQPTPHNRDGQ